jgi:thioredoxin 1
VGHPIAVTDMDFEAQVEKATMLVLVDFWADWCAPCKMIAPMVEDLANEYDGKVTFVKVDVDSSPETSSKFGIRSIPTLLLFKDGKPVDQVIGAVPKAVLKARLENALA